MSKHVLCAISLLPLLLAFSYAAQTSAIDPRAEIFGYSSDEFGSGSYLGVNIADVTSDRLEVLKLKEERGVEVTTVDADAPAGKAGIREHDVILTMNGTQVESAAQLRRMIHETPAGRVVTFGISRDGQPVTVKVQLASKREATAFVMPEGKNYKFEMPPMPSLPEFDMPVSVIVVHSSARSGLMVENLTPQLGDFFGVKNGRGVLVRSVEKGSTADKAGFRAGDVIVKVNDQPVHDTSDFTHALRSRSTGSVAVGVVRDKKEQNLTLPLPERRDKDSGSMFEETFDLPDLNAETLDLSKVRDEMARARPQMELAIEQWQKAAKDLQTNFCTQQKQMREQLNKLRDELGPQWQQNMRELKDQIERWRHELPKDGLDL